jgi:hypothetical protein
MDAPRGDPSSFYRLNEELALELQRLEREGALDRLQELLASADAELLVASARPLLGQEELLGVLRPRRAPAAQPTTQRALDPEPDVAQEGCGCGDGEAGLSAATAEAQAAAAAGWDHEGVLAARSRFTVVLPDGTAREVYMPDHVCPACGNEAQNVIDACARRCGACRFEW